MNNLKCKTCEHMCFYSGNGNPNRYYCQHPVAAKEVNVGSRMICRTERRSEEFTIKRTPKWCPENRE